MSDAKATTLRNLFCTLALVFFVALYADLVPWWLGIGLCLAMCLGAAVVVGAVEKRFRDYVYIEQPMLTGLPPETMQFFGRTSAALDELHFERIGDFCLLPEPVPLYARIYTSPGGDCFACIYTHLSGTRRVSYLAYCSVTADGTYIESASRGGKYSFDPDVPLRFRYLDDTVTASEALQQHRVFVEQHAGAAQTEPLAFRPDQFPEVLDYGHRLSCWEQYQATHNEAPSFPGGDAATACAMTAPTSLLADALFAGWDDSCDSAR